MVIGLGLMRLAFFLIRWMNADRNSLDRRIHWKRMEVQWRQNNWLPVLIFPADSASTWLFKNKQKTRRDAGVFTQPCNDVTLQPPPPSLPPLKHHVTLRDARFNVNSIGSYTTVIFEAVGLTSLGVTWHVIGWKDGGEWTRWCYLGVWPLDLENELDVGAVVVGAGVGRRRRDFTHRVNLDALLAQRLGVVAGWGILRKRSSSKFAQSESNDPWLIHIAPEREWETERILGICWNPGESPIITKALSGAREGGATRRGGRSINKGRREELVHGRGCLTWPKPALISSSKCCCNLWLFPFPSRCSHPMMTSYSSLLLLHSAHPSARHFQQTYLSTRRYKYNNHHYDSWEHHYQQRTIIESITLFIFYAFLRNKLASCFLFLFFSFTFAYWQRKVKILSDWNLAKYPRSNLFFFPSPKKWKVPGSNPTHPSFFFNNNFIWRTQILE